MHAEAVDRVVDRHDEGEYGREGGAHLAKIWGDMGGDGEIWGDA